MQYQFADLPLDTFGTSARHPSLNREYMTMLIYSTRTKLLRWYLELLIT